MPWVVPVLIISFTPVVLFPRLRDKLQRFAAPVLFLLGIAACICLYCILFLHEMNLFGLFAVFGTLWALPLTYVPHFFLLQILYTAFRISDLRSFRKFFYVGIGVYVSFAVVMALWFSAHYNTMRTALTSGNTSEIQRNYMTERMLGMHFKYHLSFCQYDGWRPPLHDPSVVVAIWLNAPFRSDLDYRGMGGPPIRTGA